MGIDLQIATFFQQLSKISFFNFAEPLLAKIGKGDFLLFGCILLAIYAYFTGKTKTMKISGGGILAVLVSGLAVQFLKRLIGRARPGTNLGDFYFLGPTFKSGFDSFPSGHATASFAFAAFFSLYYPRAAFALYPIAAAVSLGRVLYGHHFFTDIIAGAALGATIGLFLAKKLKKWIEKSNPSSADSISSPTTCHSALDAESIKSKTFWIPAFARMTDNKTHLPNLILLILFSAIPLFYGLNHSALWDRDETEYAQAALEMQEQNEWWIPTLSNQPYLEKPILMYWFVRASYLLFGFSEFSSRFPSAVFGILTCLATYFLASCLWGKKTGPYAALILSTTFLFVGCYRMFLSDTFFVFFLTTALLFYLCSRKHSKKENLFLACTYISIGFALLCKGPLAFFAVIVFLLFEWLTLFPFAKGVSANLSWRTGYSIRNLLRHFCFSLIALSIAAPWYLYSFSIEKSETAAFILHHNIARFFQSFEGHRGPMLYHLFVLLIGALPWSFFLIPAIKNEWRERVDSKAKIDAPLLLLGLWISTIFILFSLSATKLPHYMLPALPALACIIGKYWEEQTRRGDLPFQLPILLTIGLIGLITLAMGTLYFFRPVYASFRLLLPFFLLLLSLVVSFFFSKQEKQQKSFGFLWLGAVLFFVAFVHFSLPWVEKFRVMKPTALAIKELVPRQAKLVSYRLFEPSLYIYSGRLFPYEEKPVSEILKSDEPLYLLIKEKDLPKQTVAFPYEVLSKKEGFAENGGEMTLLIIRNHPQNEISAKRKRS